MIREAIDKILGLAELQYKTDHGRTFCSQQLNEIPPPLAHTLTFGTLQGLVHFLEKGPDKLTCADHLIHIAGPDKVVLHSKLDPSYLIRQRLAEAHATVGNEDPFEFGRYYDHETFVTLLQSQFLTDDSLKKLLSVAGSMTGEKVTTHTDCGVTQSVATKAGIHLKAREDIQNPVALRPFRTFREVQQPVSPFIFRVKQDRDGQIPSCALFEADGGAWKLDAMASIADALVTLLSSDTEVKIVR